MQLTINNTTFSNKKGIAKFLKSEREKRGLTRYYIAKNSKLFEPAIIKMEDGDSNFTIESLLEYLKALNH